ncbi:MAG TPA: hypothetical protein VI320_35960 [Terracidiphilus sp.]|jgi:hypothetical protein
MDKLELFSNPLGVADMGKVAFLEEKAALAHWFHPIPIGEPL